EAHQDIHNPKVDVVLRGGFLITFHEVSIAWFCPLEGTLPEKVVHESTNVQPNLRPEGLVIGLKNDPFETLEEAFFDKKGGAAHGNVLPFARLLIRTFESTRAPAYISVYREVSQHVNPQRVQSAVLQVG